MDKAQEEKQNELIAQFVEIAQTTPDEARDALDSAHWDLDDAVSNYYSGDQANTPAATNQGPANEAPAPRTSGVSSSSSSTAPSRRSNVATFADLGSGNNDPSPPPDSAALRKKRKEDLFAGGEQSGLAVQNPGQGANSDNTSHSNRLLNEILKRAEMGQQQNEDDEEEHEAPEPQQPRFTGRGQTLGSDDVPSQEVAGEEDARGNTDDSDKKVVRKLTFWQDGFSIEDGDLYRYDDPNNRGYLEAINNGQAPMALLNVRPGQAVDVHISRRMDEAYRQEGSFLGNGQRLGAVVPGVNSSSSSSSSKPKPITPASSSNPNPRPEEGEGDSVVMIRMLNGQAVKKRINKSEPLSRLYEFVDQQCPAASGYVLQTSLPPKELTEREKSIEELKLANSVVVQKALTK